MSPPTITKKMFIHMYSVGVFPGNGDHYLSGDFAAVVEVVEREGPLLPVILLHGDGALQLLKTQPH